MPRKNNTDMTAIQKRFADEWLRDFKITKAALRAGYSEKNAAQIGWATLKKPAVKEYITRRLKELEISPEETTKMICNVAKGNLADYFVDNWVEFTPRVKKPLAEILKSIKADLAFEEDFLTYAELSRKERQQQTATVTALKNMVLRYEMELERNPKGYRIVAGETTLVNRPVLDLSLLLEDKERGIIKSVTPTEYGLKVEMYPADNAIIALAKIHGLFANDNAQRIPETGKVSDDQFKELLKEVRNAKKQGTTGQ